MGIWPLTLLGPVIAVGPYLPGPAAQRFAYDSPFLLGLGLVSLAGGLVLGWRRGFPRWVYPYLAGLLTLVIIPLMSLLGVLVGPLGLGALLTSLLILAVTGGLMLGALLLFSRLPATRQLYADIRADWTRLSFGALVLLALAASFYGGDHRPPLSVAVWLPSVIVVLGGLTYLSAGGGRAGGWVLGATLLLALLAKLVIFSVETWSVYAVVLLVGLVFLPALVGLLPASNRPVSARA